MTGAAEIAAILQGVPPAGLVTCGVLMSAGAGSLLSAAADTIGAAREAVRRMAGRHGDEREVDRVFREMTRADPELRAMTGYGRRLARNHVWATGGPGAAGACACWFLRVLFAPAYGIRTVLKAREKAAERRERGKA